MSEKRSIFRERSIKSIESPEVLNAYLHVTTPGVWILMAVIIIFLLGALAWGIFAHIETYLPVAVISDDSGVYYYVSRDDLDSVLDKHKILINGIEYNYDVGDAEATVVSEDEDVYVLTYGSLEPNDIVYPVKIDADIPKDIYMGLVTTESITPISFLLND